jgi:hypothetical protein
VLLRKRAYQGAHRSQRHFTADGQSEVDWPIGLGAGRRSPRGVAFIACKTGPILLHAYATPGHLTSEPEDGIHGTAPVKDSSTQISYIVCYRHPGVETGLRCNRCGNPSAPSVLYAFGRLSPLTAA